MFELDCSHSVTLSSIWDTHTFALATAHRTSAFPRIVIRTITGVVVITV